MLFNSLSFLIFFPVVTILYFLLAHRWRWLLLLIASCVFYMFFIPYYILILFVTIVIDYLAGIWIERSSGSRRKLYLWISIVSTCLVLFVFKYFNFFVDNYNAIADVLDWNYSIEALTIILPIGLSFHTFQSLSYVIEVYRGNQKAETNFGIYSLYVMYYPQLVAGPIERPQNLLHQFKAAKSFRFQNFYSGMRLILIGLFMKLVIADRLAIYVDAAFNNAGYHTGTTLALATVFFSFQIYCDFAGYSSMAIGISRVMGIKLMTNFRRPYLSQSVSEFWRRWHISLSTWFKDYLYISLGGSRVKTKPRLYFNLFVTFLISGLWHGANWTFVIWGGLNGIYLILEGMFKANLTRVYAVTSRFKVINILYVFLLISFSWIFFRADSLDTAITIVRSIFTHPGRLFIPADPEIFIYCVIGIALLLFFEIFYEMVYKNRSIRFNRKIYSYVIMLGIIFAIMLIGVFDGGQFIYFQF